MREPMRNMSLREIAEAVGGRYVGSPEKSSVRVSGVVIDSRKVERDFLFVPIRGERVDGHAFIPQVMEAGAACTLSEHPQEDAAWPYILVGSCKQALKDLAEHYRMALPVKIIGVAGSVGKTGTKEMIASVLSQKYRVLKTEGNLNNEIGLPLTIFRIREEHEAAVLEMGISEFGEMRRLAKMARPDMCVIMNIGPSHLDNLIDLDGVLRAKTEIFEYMKPDAPILLNGDDERLLGINGKDGRDTRYFGILEGKKEHEPGLPDAYATDIISLAAGGTECTIVSGGEAVRVRIPVPGRHMIYHALAGALAGHILGLGGEEIRKGIESIEAIAGRNRKIETESLVIMDDCYNANPMSVRAALDVLAEAPSRKVAILGDMLGLGKNEGELHYELGKYAAGKDIDLVICIGKRSVETYRGIRDGGQRKKGCREFGCDWDHDESGRSKPHAGVEAVYFRDKEEFTGHAGEFIRKGDTVLVKASQNMHFREIEDFLLEMKPQHIKKR